MGARHSRRAVRSYQDDGDRESGGPASPAIYAVEPVPQGLEHVVYPRYEEAFRLGLAAFSDPTRTNLFKRELPPIFGTPEFLGHPNNGINPVSNPESVVENIQKEISAEKESLNSNLRIEAYGDNGGIGGEPNNGDGNRELCDKESKGPESNRLPEKTNSNRSIADPCIKGVLRSERSEAPSNKHHAKMDSFEASVILHSSSSSGSPDSPTPSVDHMGASRFTTPIREQLEEINIRNAHMKSRKPLSPTYSASLSLSGYLLGGGNSLDKILCGDLGGGLFDADEEFSSALLRMSMSSPAFETRLPAESSSEKVCDVPSPVVTDETGDEVGGSSPAALECEEELELFEKVYTEIRQWQSAMSGSSTSLCM